MPSSLFRLLGVLCVIGFLAGCASDKEALPADKPVEELYNAAMDLMAARDFRSAALEFQDIERQHPYSAWAARGQLMAGFSYYQAMDYDRAAEALDQFIRLHPGHADIAYAYYLRALTDYERIADVRRDQTHTRNAQQSLQTVISRFPETTYAKDAVLKLSLINDHLAGAKMEVGRNYLKQKLYTAAIGRFRTVVDQFQTTSHVPEALHRLVESYVALGLVSEAQAAAAVLGHNFPGSPWYQDSFKLLSREGLAIEAPSPPA